MMLFSLRLSVAFTMLGICMPARAAMPILIWPIDPVIEADRGAAALWLENRGNKPTVMQIRAFRWSQVDGEDNYDEQSEVEASPPIARIQPGARQLIRLTSPLAGRQPGESAYRIIVDELPAKPTDQDASVSGGDETSTSVGIQFQMRYSIPLFVYAPLADGTKLDPKSSSILRCNLLSQQGQTLIQIVNTGKTHVRLVDVSFQGKGEPIFLGKGLMGYFLPGTVKTWPLPQGVTGREPLTMASAGGGRTSIQGCAT